MTHDEIKQKAIDYCNSRAEKGRSFNPLTVDDLVKFAESCNEKRSRSVTQGTDGNKRAK